ncbi:MAG: cytochrome c oxidase subunit II, partial [Candidatus Methylomirabilales bacterium]
VSTYGKDVDFLFYLIYYITGGTFVLVAAAMIAFLILYRHKEGRRATYTHGNTALEIIWTIVPTLILVVLTFLSVPTWARIKMQMPQTDLQIQVTAKQFNWQIAYPGPDGKFGTEDDKTFDNEVHVPVGKPVILILKSRDVIHSFYMPNLRFKQDAVPGREIPQWFQATKPGKYEIPCAELCGFGHSGMRGWLYVHTPEDYQKWVKEQWPSS